MNKLYNPTPKKRMKMSAMKTSSNGKKLKIICKYFILGKCNKGDCCPYVHNILDKSQNTPEIECPMYKVGFCKIGPLCHYLHIKKEKNIEDELEEKITTSTTPINDEQLNSVQSLKDNTNELTTTANNIDINIEKDNVKEKEKFKEKDKENLGNELNDTQNDFLNFPEIPIWYIEHYFDKPISIIFSELEQKNLPEVEILKKKYGFTNIEPNLPLIHLLNKKNKNPNNLNMTALNMNVNLSLNKVNPRMKQFLAQSITNNFITNDSLQQNNNQSSNNKSISNGVGIGINSNNENFSNTQFDAYSFKKDSIEYIINKEKDIYYYLIRCENYDIIKKSMESNTIKLPEELYNKYKNGEMKANKLTIIIIIFDNENNNFSGFAKLKYPLDHFYQINENKVSIDHNLENNEKKSFSEPFTFKIEWLWRTKLHYTKINHLMNRADHDHFINQGKNGCPIDRDLGNYCCRLMIKRLSKNEVKELINHKKIFEDQVNQEYHENNEDIFYRTSEKEDEIRNSFKDNYFVTKNEIKTEEERGLLFSRKKRISNRGNGIRKNCRNKSRSRSRSRDMNGSIKKRKSQNKNKNISKNINQQFNQQLNLNQNEINFKNKNTIEKYICYNNNYDNNLKRYKNFHTNSNDSFKLAYDTNKFYQEYSRKNYFHEEKYHNEQKNYHNNYNKEHYHDKSNSKNFYGKGHH